MTALERLKLLTDETDAGACADCAAPAVRQYSDVELTAILSLHDGDAVAAAYDVLMRKSQNTGVTLGDMSVADQSKYYLRRAKAVRKNAGCALPRADAPEANA